MGSEVMGRARVIFLNEKFYFHWSGPDGQAEQGLGPERKGMDRIGKERKSEDWNRLGDWPIFFC